MTSEEMLNTLNARVNHEDWFFDEATVIAIGRAAGLRETDYEEIIQSLCDRSRGLDGGGWEARTDEEMIAVLSV
jgi:hypothetical protein